MFNTQITKISFMDFPHVITEHAKGPERRYVITDFAEVFQQSVVSILYLLATKPYFKLSLKQSISEHFVTKLFVWLDGFREHNLKNRIY